MDRNELTQKLAEAKAEVERIEKALKEPVVIYLGSMYHPGNGDGAKIVTIDASLCAYSLTTKTLTKDSVMALRSAPTGFIALLSVERDDRTETIAFATGDRWHYDKDAVALEAEKAIRKHLGFENEFVMSNELDESDVGKRFQVVETAYPYSKDFEGLGLLVTGVDCGEVTVTLDRKIDPYVQSGFDIDSYATWKLRRIS